MSTELVHHQDAGLPEKMEWARAMATSNLLPRQYQNNPGNLLFAVEYADALGVSRINAITSIHVIEGKPSASADLIAGLIRRAGHKLRVSGDDTYALAQLIRADDPEFTYEARWDAAKAKAAGLAGKSVWKNYPAAMLRARAITEVARMGASDALFGVIYTPEELGAEVQGDGTVVHAVTTVRPPASGAERMRQALGQQPTEATDPDPQPASEAPVEEGITPAQVKKIGAAMSKAGLSDRDAALDFVAQVIGRTVASRNDLTKGEASNVIDALETGELPPAQDDVVDAEVVDDAEAVWQQIVAAAAEMGMNQSVIAEDYAQFSGGEALSAADAGQLQAYLANITTSEKASA